MDVLLKLGADANTVDKLGNSSLHSACKFGSASTLAMLLPLSASLSHSNFEVVNVSCILKLADKLNVLRHICSVFDQICLAFCAHMEVRDRGRGDSECQWDVCNNECPYCVTREDV